LLETPAPAAFVPRIADPAALELARALLDLPTGHADWSDSAIAPLYHSAFTIASVARHLAETRGGCHPECAWAAGLLAPLGWFAVAAVAPESAIDCLHDGASDEAQGSHWGLDAAAIARRLARRWQLPPRLPAVPVRLPLT